MKAPIPTVVTLVLATLVWSCAPQREIAPSRPNAAVEQDLLDLSRQKWLWMADKDVDALGALFHADARFVHMGGTWGTARELEIIETGSIHYMQADVHEAVVETFGDTAVVWNQITLLAEVRGTEVTNPFTVTEVYQREGGAWTLLALTFSSIRDGHEIEP